MLHFEANADRKPDLIKIMDKMMPKIKAQKECKDCMFITHDEEGSYAFLVFWKTKEEADAASAIIGPELLPALNKIAKAPVKPLLYEVYQPASVASEKQTIFN